ncbi:MAG: threonine synthase [Bacteroidetes bacterium]|nr:MAG: threonine synthase [Bacteroidota bacterium]
MKYYSLNHKSEPVSFREATILGQAPDKGLYFPEQIPRVNQNLISNIHDFSNEEIAFSVMQPYLGDEMPEEMLRKIVNETIDFPIPLIPVTGNIFSLELFHGPTLAFKDVGARFMSRCLGYFAVKNAGKITVLVATSGDTGGAVANGFYGVDGVEVVILYPAGKVSSVQEKQLTTLGKNIHALEVSGTFDDCQHLVKQAFADKDLTQTLSLTSANSINVARWLPQQLYYFLAYKRWPVADQAPVFSVPSGNFGNICAGMLASISGLPVKHFIAACNANDVVPNYLVDGQFIAKTAVQTISNAMDVANPSNFVRVMQLFDQNFFKLKEKLTAYSVSDGETREAIKKVKIERGYLLDPHGAVGYISLDRYLESNPGLKGIFLETAHPVKFLDVVEPITGEKIQVPSTVASILPKQKNSHLMNADYGELKEFLTQSDVFKN